MGTGYTVPPWTVLPVPILTLLGVCARTLLPVLKMGTGYSVPSVVCVRTLLPVPIFMPHKGLPSVPGSDSFWEVPRAS